MKKRMWALALAAVLMLGSLAGCGTKNEPENTENAGQKAEQDAQEVAAEEVWKAEFSELPETVEFVNESCLSGKTLFFYTWVRDEADEGMADMKLMMLDLDTHECRAADYAPQETETSGTSVTALCAAPDGGVYLLEQTYFYEVYEEDAGEAEDAQEDAAGVSYSGDGSAVMTSSGKQTSYRLLRFDAEGQAVSNVEVDISAFIENGDSEPYLSTLLADDKGNVYVGSWQMAVVLDAEGRTVCTLADEDGGNLMQYSEDTVGLITYASNADGSGGTVFKVFDPETKDWGEELALPDSCWQIWPGSGEYDCYYERSNNVYGWKAKEQTGEKVVDWLSCDIDAGDVQRYFVLEDGRVVALSTTYDNSDYSSQTELIVLTKVPATSVAEKTELTLACMGVGYQLRGQIVKFNRENEKYRIVVKDYSEYNSAQYVSIGGATAVTSSEDGLTKLNTEIMAGNVPDLLLTESLPVRQYAAKGLLEDLYPYLDADMGREALVEPVLRAEEMDGGLYELPLSFQIYSAAGLGKVVGGYDSWTLDALQDAMGRLNEGATIFNVEVTRDTMLLYCLYMNADSFVDWSTKTASFDSPEFIDYLNFANQFPAEFDYATFDWETYEDDAVRMRRGDQLLTADVSLYGFDSVYESFARMGNDLCYVGFPSASGNDGSSFAVSDAIAMTATCADKAGAWSFISSLLDEDYQSQLYAFPMRKSALEASAAKAMEKDYETDENGEVSLDENGEPIEISKGGVSYNGGEMIELYAMTEEQYATVMGLIESTSRIMRYDTSLTEIINDEASAFFAGECTAEEAAARIQNRVQLYMAEQG